MKTSSLAMLCTVWMTLLASVPASAQLYSNWYGGNDIDYAFQLIRDPDGNYVMTGRSYSFIAPGADFFGDIYTIKVDSAYDLLWTSVFQTAGEDEGNAIANAHGGGYLIAGAAYDSLTGYDLTLLKLDTGGTGQWSKLLGTGLNDQAEVIIPTSDNAYLIGGYSDSLFSGVMQSFTPFVAKIGSGGSVIWAKRFGFSSGVFSGSVYGALETSDGSFLLTGDIIRQFQGPDDSDIFLARFSSSGNLLWFKWIGENCQGCQDMGSQILEKNPGVFTLLASTGFSGMGLYLCDFDLNGTILQESFLPTGTFAYNRVFGVNTTAGERMIATPAYGSILLTRVNSQLQAQWSAVYGAGTGNVPCSIVKNDHGYVVGGFSDPLGPFREDFYMMYIDYGGSSCSLKFYPSLTSMPVHLPDSTGGAASVMGFSESSSGWYSSGGEQRMDCFGYTGIEKIPAERTKAFPNPFGQSLYLSFSDQLPRRVRVYNSLGMLMSEVVAKESLRIPAHNWPSGVYFVQTDDNQLIKIIRE